MVEIVMVNGESRVAVTGCFPVVTWKDRNFYLINIFNNQSK